MEIKNTFNPLDPYNQTKLASVNQTGKIAASTANTASAKGAETGDRVSFSLEAKLRTEAFTTASNAPDVRADKVAELKAQIEAGEYTLDSSAIAAKLMAEETGLFQHLDSSRTSF